MITDHLPHTKGLIIDMDGVIWRDSQPIGDLPLIFKKITGKGLKFIFATNNASRTVSEYLDKLHGFGVEVEPWQVITAAMATGIYLREAYPDGCRIYVVGQPSLKKTLAGYGHFIVDEMETDVQVVVGSIDYLFSYEKLKHASLLIQRGCQFVGTNPDVTLPTPEGFIPGSGTVIKAIEIASNTKPTIDRETGTSALSNGASSVEPAAGRNAGDRRQVGNRYPRCARSRDSRRAGPDRRIHG